MNPEAALDVVIAYKDEAFVMRPIVYCKDPTYQVVTFDLVTRTTINPYSRFDSALRKSMPLPGRFIVFIEFKHPSDANGRCSLFVNNLDQTDAKDLATAFHRLRSTDRLTLEKLIDDRYQIHQQNLKAEERLLELRVSLEEGKGLVDQYIASLNIDESAQQYSSFLKAPNDLSLEFTEIVYENGGLHSTGKGFLTVNMSGGEFQSIRENSIVTRDAFKHSYKQVCTDRLWHRLANRALESHCENPGIDTVEKRLLEGATDIYLPLRIGRLLDASRKWEWRTTEIANGKTEPGDWRTSQTYKKCRIVKFKNLKIGDSERATAETWCASISGEPGSAWLTKIISRVWVDTQYGVELRKQILSQPHKEGGTTPEHRRFRLRTVSKFVTSD